MPSRLRIDQVGVVAGVELVAVVGVPLGVAVLVAVPVPAVLVAVLVGGVVGEVVGATVEDAVVGPVVVGVVDVGAGVVLVVLVMTGDPSEELVATGVGRTQR